MFWEEHLKGVVKVIRSKSYPNTETVPFEQLAST